MPDLKYYSELTSFPRTADLNSFLVLIDQSGVNPNPLRVLGSTLLSGVTSVSTTGVLSGLGTSGSPIDVSGELVTADYTTGSLTGDRITDDIFSTDDFANSGVVNGAYLTFDSSSATLFNWITPYSFVTNSAGNAPLPTFNLSTGIYTFPSLVGGTNITINETTSGIEIVGVAPAAPSTVVSDLGSGTVFNIDVSTADVFRLNATGNATITATNFAANVGKQVVVYVTHNGNTVTIGSGISLGQRTDEPVELNASVSNFIATTSALWFLETAKPQPSGGFDPSDLLSALKFRVRGGFGLDAETGETRLAITGASDPVIETGVANGEDVLYFDQSVGSGLAFPIGSIWSSASEVHMCFEFDSSPGSGGFTSNTGQYIVMFPANSTSTNFFDAIFPPSTGSTTNELDIRYRVHWSNTIPTKSDFTINDVPCRDTTDSRAHFCIWTYDATNSDPYVNGSVVTNPGSDTSNFGTPPNPYFSLGCSISSNLTLSGNFSNMRLAELLVTTPLSAADRQKIEGYFAWTYWGTSNPLPAIHPYKLIAP